MGLVDVWAYHLHPLPPTPIIFIVNQVFYAVVHLFQGHGVDLCWPTILLQYYFALSVYSDLVAFFFTIRYAFAFDGSFYFRLPLLIYPLRTLFHINIIVYRPFQQFIVGIGAAKFEFGVFLR